MITTTEHNELSKIYSYLEFGEHWSKDCLCEMTEQEILDTYWEHWKGLMEKKYGLNHELTTKHNCIQEWIVVNWAWEKEK